MRPVRAACQKGLTVGFITAAALVHELIEARDEKRLLRFQKQLAKYKLLIIDELGFVPLSKTGAELLFEVFSQRYEGGGSGTGSSPALIRAMISAARRRASSAVRTPCTPTVTRFAAFPRARVCAT